jgi:hypothetical protein
MTSLTSKQGKNSSSVLRKNKHHQRDIDIKEYLMMQQKSSKKFQPMEKNEKGINRNSKQFRSYQNVLRSDTEYPINVSQEVFASKLNFSSKSNVQTMNSSSKSGHKRTKSKSGKKLTKKSHSEIVKNNLGQEIYLPKKFKKLGGNSKSKHNQWGSVCSKKDKSLNQSKKGASNKSKHYKSMVKMADKKSTKPSKLKSKGKVSRNYSNGSDLDSKNNFLNSITASKVTKMAENTTIQGRRNMKKRN